VGRGSFRLLAALLPGIAAWSLVFVPVGSGRADRTASTTCTAQPVTTTASAEHFTPAKVTTARPSGLIDVQEYKPPTAFDSAVLEHPWVSGIDFRANWNDIEPYPHQFNWKPIDEVFAQAAASHKYVILSFVPGFGTPSWALKGVRYACFGRQYGPEAGQPGWLPLPWDRVYLAHWFTFLQKVDDRYGSDPAFRTIAAAGPTSVSDEMSEPDATGKGTSLDPAVAAKYKSSDLAQWIGLGYTPARYEAAWKTVFETYTRIFHRQYVSFALHGGLPIGVVAPKPGERYDFPEKAATFLDVLKEGRTTPSLQHRFVFFGAGLQAKSDGPNSYRLVQSYSGTAVTTGFQMDTSATSNPGREAGSAWAARTPADELYALCAALGRGLQAHVNFLEVYELDMENPAMASELTKAARQIRLPDGSLTCVPPG
jgi:hypothetical protein